MRRSRAAGAAAGLLAVLLPARAEGQTGYNVVVITLEATRADHLGSYGYARNTTPFLDRLAAEGTRFARAYVQAPWTLPSLATLWTSAYPELHRAPHEAVRLRDGLRTFAEHARSGGYETAAFVGGLPGDVNSGLTRGFGTVVTSPENRTAFLLGQAAEWARARRERPFFLWVHAFETHFPYSCPEPERDQYDPGYAGSADGARLDSDADFQRRFIEEYNGAPDAGAGGDPALRDAVLRIRRSPGRARHFGDRYDGCLNYLDRQIEAFYGTLKRMGAARETVWVVSSDHGEYLGAAIGKRPPLLTHPMDDVHEDLLRVPLILSHPSRWRGRTVADPVMLVDVAPTLADLAGLAPFSSAQGESLAPWLDGKTASRPHPFVYSSSYLFYNGAWVWALQENGFKLMRSETGWSLFDLKADPLEQTDASPRRPEVFLELSRRRLDQHFGTLGP